MRKLCGWQQRNGKLIGVAVALLLVSLLLTGAARPAARDNSSTTNLNVLFMGVQQGKLEVIALFSINHKDRMQAAAIFFPTATIVRQGQQLVTLGQIHQKQGAQALEKVLEALLAVDIAYQVQVDQRVLAEVTKFIDPIVIDDQEIPLTNLFTMELSPADEQILGALLERFTQPRVFFWHLPQMILTFGRYVSTNFSLAPANLWLHYRIARGVDTSSIPKVIIAGQSAAWEGKTVWVASGPQLKRIVYDLTGP